MCQSFFIIIITIVKIQDHTLAKNKSSIKTMSELEEREVYFIGGYAHTHRHTCTNAHTLMDGRCRTRVVTVAPGDNGVSDSPREH